MPSQQGRRRLRFVRASLVVVALFGSSPAAPGLADTGPQGLDLVCPLLEHESQRLLQDYELDLELVENEHQARRKLFDMVEALWAVRSIEKEIYLDYKRLRDRTKIRVARVGAQIARQKSISQQYVLSCAQARGEASAEDVTEQLQSLVADYRTSDCELLARDAEIAEVDMAYDAAMLEATRVLVDSNISTKFELVVKQYNLSQSRARVEGFRRRARSCKAALTR